MKYKTHIIIVFLLAIIASSCETKKDSSEELNNEAPRQLPVKVMNLQKAEIGNILDYTSTLAAFEEVYFAPSAPGKIEKIYVEIGDKVNKGQTIAEMDQTPLLQAKIQLKQLEVDYNRMKELRKTETVSEQQYDQVKVQYDVAKANIEFLEENTTLLAPFNGVVTAKYFEDGEVYSGAPNTQAGKAAIVTLMQIKPVKAVISVSEKYFENVKDGLSASLKTGAYPGQEFIGEVYRIHPTINPATRTFNVEIVVDNKNEKLRPGMYSKVSLKLGDYEAIMVPALAVLQQQGTNERFVFLYDNGKAKKVFVDIGKRFDDRLEILGDEITEAAQVVVTGQKNLSNGTEVRIIN